MPLFLSAHPYTYIPFLATLPFTKGDRSKKVRSPVRTLSPLATLPVPFGDHLYPSPVHLEPKVRCKESEAKITRTRTPEGGKEGGKKGGKEGDKVGGKQRGNKGVRTTYGFLSLCYPFAIVPQR